VNLLLRLSSTARRDSSGRQKLTKESHISDPRTNDRIRVPEVRLVGPGGEQVGVVRIEDAIRLAQEADLDLVEVAPNSKPPVAKIMDFGKFKYETAQKAKEAKRNQSNTILKEVRFRLKIDVHDYETKRKRAEGFLQQGDKVKAMILFRGREQSRPEQGVRLLQRFAEDVSEFGTVESTPTIDGRNMVMVIGPLKTKAEVKAEHDAKKPTSRPERSESTDAPAAAEEATASSKAAPAQPAEQPLATFAKAPPRTAPERSTTERSSERPERTERSAPTRSSSSSAPTRSSASSPAPRSSAPSSSAPSSSAPAPSSSAAPAARVASAAAPAAKIAAAAASAAKAPAAAAPAAAAPTASKPATSKPATPAAAAKPATPGSVPKPAPKPGAAAPKPAAKAAPKAAPKTAPADSPTN